MNALSWLKNTRLEEQKQSQEADDDQQEQFTSTEPMQWFSVTIFIWILKFPLYSRNFL